MAKIYIGIPTYDKKVDVEILTTIARLPDEYPQHQFGIDYIASSLITDARNYLVKRFLDSDFDWLYFWDADLVVRDMSFIGKLLETADKFDAGIVGGLYRIKHDKGNICVAKYSEDGSIVNYQNGEITEPMLIDLIGTGGMMISRSTLEKVGYPWFSFVDLPDGKIISEDYNFCLLAKKQGVKIAIDPRFNTYHFGYAFWEHHYKPTES